MSDKKDFKKILVSIFSKFSYQIISIVIVFFLTPLVIKTFGDYRYGLWILVNVFAGYAAYADLGLSSSIERNLAVALGEKNEEAFKSIFVNGILLNLISFIVVVAISFIAFNIVNFLQIKDYELISKLLLLIGLNLAFTFPLRSFYGIIVANIRFDIISGVNLFQLITTSLLTVYLLLNGYGLIALAAAQLAVTVVANFSYVFIAPKLSNLICYDVKLINKKVIGKLFSYSGKTVLVQIADILKFKFDEIITAAFISVSTVTMYSIGNKLNQNASSFSGNFLVVLHPLFSKNMNIKTDEEKIKLFYFTSKIIITMSCMFFFGFLFLGKQFINLWIGPEYSVAYYVLVILSFFSFIGHVQGTGIQYLYSANKHQYIAYIGIIEGFLNLIFSLIYVLYFKLGVVGVALGTLTPALFTKLFILPRYICKTLKIKLQNYNMFFKKNILIGGLIYLPVGFFALKFNIDNYPVFFGFVFIFMLLFMVHFILIIDKQEKELLIKKLLSEFKAVKTRENNEKECN